MITRAKSGIFKPKIFAVSKPICELHATPLSVSEALADVNWKKAMVNEFQALMRNNTLELLPAIENQHVVSNKWVYRVKYKADGSPNKYKARLVAKGFQQTIGVNFLRPSVQLSNHLLYGSNLL